MPPRQKSLNETKGPSVHKAQKSPQGNNQKKSLTNVHRKPIYKAEFQKKTIIQLDSNGDKFYCDICPDKLQLLRKKLKQWDKEENFQDFILPDDIFIQTIIREIDPNLKDILLLEEESNKNSQKLKKISLKSSLFWYIIFL